MTDANDSVTWQSAYPARYYAYPDNDNLVNGYPRAGFVDVEMWSDKPTSLPVADAMIPLTLDQWNARGTTNQVVKSGQVVTEIPSAPVIPLITQAATALSIARAYVMNNYYLLGESVPAEWIAYQKALIAISNGTDTTSTTLPLAPATS